MKNRNKIILVIILITVIGFGGFYLLQKKPSTFNFLLKTNYINFNEHYIEIYNSNTNQYEIYNNKFEKMQSFSEKSTLNSTEFYQNDGNVYYKGVKLSFGTNGVYNYNNKIYYLNSTKLHYSSDKIYIDEDNLIYNNETGNNIKVSDNYQLIIMNNKLKAIYDDNKIYLIDNNFKLSNIDGKLISDIKIPFCEYDSNEVNYYNERYILVKNGNNILVMNIENNSSESYNYDDLLISSDEKYYIVKKNNSYGIIDSSNNFKVNLKYSNIEYDGEYYYLYNNDIITILDKNLNKILTDVKVDLSKNMSCYNGSRYKVLINDKIIYFVYNSDVYIYMNNNLTMYTNGYIYDDFVVLDIDKAYKLYDLDMKEYSNFNIINNEYSDDVRIDININYVNNNYLDIVLYYAYDDGNVEVYHSYDLKNKKMLDDKYEYFGYQKYHEKFYLKESSTAHYLYDLNMKELYNQSEIFDVNKIFGNLYYIHDINNNSYQLFEYKG